MTKTSTATARRGIESVLAAFVDAWNAHDMKAWGALFTPDVDYINRAGGWWVSREENGAEHRRIHEGLRVREQEMRYELELAKASLLATGVALVHARWKWPDVQLRRGEPKKEAEGIMTMVMMEQEGEWKIRALHNTVSEDPPFSASPRDYREGRVAHAT